MHVPFVKLDDVPQLIPENINEYLDAILDAIENQYKEKAQVFGEEMLNTMFRHINLQIIDNHWRDHLMAIDELREGVGLRGYAQQDPLVEYQREASVMFQEMMASIKKEIFEKTFRATVMQVETEQGTVSRLVFMKEEGRQSAAETAQSQVQAQQQRQQAESAGAQKGSSSRPAPVRRAGPKANPNGPCPCGSGKKYKKCCGLPPTEAPAHEEPEPESVNR